MNDVVQKLLDKRMVLFKYLRSFTSNIDDMEDIFQNAAEKLLKYGNSTVLIEEDEEGYLKTVLKHCVFDFYRRNDTEHLEDVDNQRVDVTFDQLFESRNKDCRDTLEKVLEDEAIINIPRFIEEHFEPGSHEPLRLLFIDHLSYADVSKVTRIHEPTLRKLAQRFRDKVRK